jgi:hypothetical protein
MENKLLKESHNRQEKVWKFRDYREDFIVESRDKSTAAHIERFRQELAHKQNVIECFCDGFYYMGDYRMNLYWESDEFLKKNKLDATTIQIEQLYSRIWRTAIADLGRIVKAIQAAKVAWNYWDNSGNYEPRIEINPAIRCDFIFPAFQESKANKRYPKVLSKTSR